MFKMRKTFPLILLMIIAVYPVWLWQFRRLTDGSDEPYGIIAMLTLLILAIRQNSNKKQQAGTVNLIIPAFVLLFYAVSYHFVPPLIRAMVAMSALILTLSRLQFNSYCNVGLWGMGMLSLPIIASLQFYIGYPLRCLVGMLSIPLLRLAGFAVVREGAGIRFGEQLVMIDAPCSGIKMLWVGGYLVCLLAVLWNLNPAKTVLAGLAGILVIIAGNALRSSALFYKESGYLILPQWTHEAIGLVAFTITAVALVILVSRLTPKERSLPA